MLLGNDIFILIEILMLQAIEIEIAFFHSLGNPKGHTLDYFFHASHIRHKFLYKLIPISMSYLKYFLSYQQKQYKCIVIGTTLEHLLQNSFLI